MARTGKKSEIRALFELAERKEKDTLLNCANADKGEVACWRISDMFDRAHDVGEARDSGTARLEAQFDISLA